MKFRRVVPGLLVVVTLCALLLAVHSPAHAVDQGISLQISPLPIMLDTKPGTSVGADLRVRNAGSQTEQLQVHVLKVTEDNNGVVHFSEPGPGDTWAKWISFSQTKFTAPPNQWQTIHMNIDVPASAAFGYYYAVEYMRATPDQPQPGKEVARGAVATFILLNADSPGAKREAQLVSFGANHKWYEFLPASFTAKVKATGNVYVAPHGNIFITKGGKQVDAISINAAEGNILPNSSRFFSAAWGNGFPHTPIDPATGQPKGGLQWDFSKANRLRFGHYTAHLYMIYDNGQRDVPLEASVSFWVVPIRAVLLFIAIPVVPAAAVYFLMRWRFKKRISKGAKG